MDAEVKVINIFNYLIIEFFVLGGEGPNHNFL